MTIIPASVTITHEELDALQFWANHGLAGLEHSPDEFEDIPEHWAALAEGFLDRADRAVAAVDRQKDQNHDLRSTDIPRD